ncbi:MAG: DUF1351 domain-containing protein [Spirochaetaceae bacterium]|nr:DUF1351 domain-containing protein [Spirochaetaceae bacterium]
MSEEQEAITLALPELKTEVLKGVVSNNLGVLKVYLEGVEKQLADIKVTKETLSQGKETRATLNRLFKELNARRIAIHKEFEAPYDAFNEAFKETTASLSAVIVNVDEQIKAVEQQIADEKQKAIDELVDEAVGKIQDTEPEVARIAGSVSWFQLKEWLNATYSLGNVQKDIDKQLDIIRSAMGMIGRSKHAPQLLARFKETGSASDLMRYDTELAAQDKQAEALLQQDAASRQAAVPEPRKIEQEPVQESFDPYTIRIKKPENEKQKTVGVFLLEFTAPAYVVASIRDHLNRTGCEVDVKSFKVKR